MSIEIERTPIKGYAYLNVSFNIIFTVVPLLVEYTNGVTIEESDVVNINEVSNTWEP